MNSPSTRIRRLISLGLAMILALAPLAAQAGIAGRIGGVEARLDALAASAKTVRMASGGLALAAGLGGGTALIILGPDFLWDSVPKPLVGGGAIVAASVAGGLAMGLPSRAETYAGRFKAMAGGLFGQDEAKLAVGEAWLEDLADRGRRGRVAGAVLAFSASAWGFLGSGWFDSLIPIPGFSSTISPFAALPEGESVSASIGVAGLAMGLVCVILRSEAEESWDSYRRSVRFAGGGPGDGSAGVSGESATGGMETGGEHPVLALAPDCFGLRLDF